MARYGTMEAFGLHLGRTGLLMGVEKAKRLIFLSDGLRANWQICLDHFPGALQILDFYHASEHLGQFCALYKNSEKGQRRYEQWYQMFLDGEALQVIAEMKGELNELSSKDEGMEAHQLLQHQRRSHELSPLPCRKTCRSAAVRWKAVANSLSASGSREAE